MLHGPEAVIRLRVKNITDLVIQNCSNTLAAVIVVQCVNAIPGRLGSQSKLQLLFIIVPVMPYHAE